MLTVILLIFVLSVGGSSEKIVETIVDAQYTLRSPNYPKPYPDMAHYHWTFTRQFGIWAVVFEEFEIEHCQRCSCDNLTISGPREGNHTLGPLCDKDLQDTYFSQGSILHVTFMSDKLINNGGFVLRVLHGHNKEDVQRKIDTRGSTIPSRHVGANRTGKAQPLVFQILVVCLVVAAVLLVVLGSWLTMVLCRRRRRNATIPAQIPYTDISHGKVKLVFPGPSKPEIKGGRRYSKQTIREQGDDTQPKMINVQCTAQVVSPRNNYV